LPKYPDFTAIIIGAVTADQKMFTGGLKKRVAEAGLSERVVFLGELDSEELPCWFRRMTVVVGAQRWEGFGLVPVEAMASGAAVVATRVGAAHHILVDGDTGFLVPPDNQDALTAQIEKLMQDPDLAAKFGRQGRIRASVHFSIEREASEIQAVYESFWSGRPVQ
ncbi:MAG TPA: glycosyltransferase family 4 protein, partial [Verrucomicrobiae bacterium]|nr:glycosyltransferase family 4 protein [Verrucomicrobiae bacterium]